MDLSGLKWPLILVVVIGLGWLVSSGGVSWMVGRATAATPGVDLEQDARDEARLSTIAGYQLMLWRYGTAAELLQMCLDRYGEQGANHLHNRYRMVRCQEKLGNYQRAYNILQYLMRNRAWEYDRRVPDFDTLNLRAERLREVHELGL